MKIRDRGISFGKLLPGHKNCITDVEGVKVGHVTLDFPLDEQKGEYACTGVTAILPHGGNLFKEKVPAASYVINGFGKTTGLVQIDELGMIESPIMLTNTFAVPAVAHGTLQYMLASNPEIGESTGTINIVVGECNDSLLNSIRLLPVKPEHAIEAIEKATDQPVQEGAVGAGKGMVCFGYKGGVGSSSRQIADEKSGETYIIGCLVVTNFGKKEEFQKTRYHLQLAKDKRALSETADGSIMMVLATNAPLSDRQLKRVAKRCGIGLGRTGSHYSHGSGDIVIAFSTANKTNHFSRHVTEHHRQLRDDHPLMNEFFTGAAEAAEEAILNSISQAETTTGRKGHIAYKYPF